MKSQEEKSDDDELCKAPMDKGARMSLKLERNSGKEDNGQGNEENKEFTGKVKSIDIHAEDYHYEH